MGKEAKVQPDRTSGLKDDRFCLEITPAGGGVRGGCDKMVSLWV